MDPADHDVRSTQDVLEVVRRRWRLLLLVVVLGVAAAVALSLAQPSRYTAEATVLVQSRTQVDDPGRSMDPQEVATQADVVTSDAVTERVIEELGLDVGFDELREALSVTPVDDKRVVAVEATWGDAEGAAAVANAFADAYIEVADVRAQGAQEAVTDSYVQRLSAVAAQMSDIRSQWRGASQAERLDLRAQIESLRARQAELQSSLLLADDPLTFTSGGVVLVHAEAPTQRSAPQPERAGLLGGAIGLVLGLLLVYLRDRRDDNIRSGRSLPPTIEDIPVLAQVPVEQREVHGRVASLAEPFSPVAEAYRSLSTSVRFLLAVHGGDRTSTTEPGRSGKLLMIGSAQPSEGKTSAATNLAVAAARSGLRVVLVDADLRSPGLAERFGVDVSTGLTDVLRDSASPVDHMVEVGVDGLAILPAGMVPPNPAELLSSPRCAQLWQELRRYADLVVVDTPPLLRVPDAMEVAGHADVVVLVARERASRGRYVTAVRRRLQRIGAPLSGLVITGAPLKRSEFQHGYGNSQREMV